MATLRQLSEGGPFKFTPAWSLKMAAMTNKKGSPGHERGSTGSSAKREKPILLFFNDSFCFFFECESIYRNVIHSLPDLVLTILLWLFFTVEEAVQGQIINKENKKAR